MYIDTNIFIYLFEHHPQYGPAAAKAITDLQNKHRPTTSTLTLSECLAKVSGITPNTFEQLPNLSLVVVDKHIAIKSAEIQNTHRIKIGDAIHLATAAELGCKIFLTNDKKLASIAKNYLSIALLSDYT